MEETTIEIGGNKFYRKFGAKLVKWGTRLQRKGAKTVISNPTCKLLGPFILKVDFTVDGNKKYQVVVQGDYKTRFRNHGSDENPLSVDEMFMLITQKQGMWFLKS